MAEVIQEPRHKSDQAFYPKTCPFDRKPWKNSGLVDPSKNALWRKIITYEKLFRNNYFQKLRIPRVILLKSLPFPEILRVQNPLKITKNNSPGIIFVITSCQRVMLEHKHLYALKVLITCNSLLGLIISPSHILWLIVHVGFCLSSLKVLATPDPSPFLLVVCWNLLVEHSIPFVDSVWEFRLIYLSIYLSILSDLNLNVSCALLYKVLVLMPLVELFSQNAPAWAICDLQICMCYLNIIWSICLSSSFWIWCFWVCNSQSEFVYLLLRWRAVQVGLAWALSGFLGGFAVGVYCRHLARIGSAKS